MNKLEILALIDKGLMRHAGTMYGEICGVENVAPTPADPTPHLIVQAPDPMGVVRMFRVDITEL